ncbi:SDR family NAD(P)-dependent oxidoreductase [Sphingobium sp. AP50]|uniref:SDR family NAD(P)-dependent oxidoreductase n=1 Tax=Sphingobium sp. AP50 TaxID=1884369 RepID=UPI00210C807D|nr:SDR family oxidoreductase [Sphingobium sp. AP50]
MDQQAMAFGLNLKGKVAVVLGASAEGGTGWAIAETLARNGASVVVAARSLPPLERLAERIGGAAFRCDAGVEADIKALAAFALERYGRVDIAVNSAGLPVMGMISEMTQTLLDDATRVNFHGPTFFIKYMAEAIDSNGAIIFISSMSTTHPVMPHIAYAAAKSAADCIVRYAAIEYGPRNIRVNSILPGPINSDMAKEAFADPDFERAYAREIPVGRVGLPDDFANAVLWLAGPSYVSGLNLQVNGGNQLTRMPRPDELAKGADSYGSGKALGDR